MKRVLAVVFIVVILSFGAIILAPSFIDLNIYKSKAIKEVKQRTGLELNLNGELDFSLFPAPRFIANDVSIASPEGSKNDELLAFKRLDVNIDLMPLFKGQVFVKSITLVKPVITLEMLKNGSVNILTKELQSLMGAGGSNKQELDISLDNIRIKDGAFSYLDHRNGNNILIQNINADLNAESLFGPFRAQGSLFYDGNVLNFDVSSGKYDAENKVLSPKAVFTLQPNNLTLEYAGVASFADGFSLQGQTSVDVTSLDVPLKAKGLLSITEKTLSYKDFDMLLGGDKFNGTLRIDFIPLEYALSLKSLTDVDLQKIAQNDLPFEKASIDIKISGNKKLSKIKNATIKLDKNIFKISGNIQHSQDIEGYIEVDVKEIDTNALPSIIKGANIKTKFKGSTKAMDMTINATAMGGAVIASGKLNDPLQNPAMDDVTLQIKHKNMAQAIKLLTGAQINDKNMRKPLDLYAKITQSGQKYSLNEIKGDLSGASVQGDLDIDMGAKKPKIKGDLVFGNLNIASVMAQQKSSKSAARWSKEHIDSAALHAINADISLKANKIKYGEWSLLKPSLRLSLNDGALNISDLKAGLFGGSIAMNSNITSLAKPRQPIHFKSNLIVENADLGSLSKAMLGTQLVKISGKGGLSMDIKSSGASPAALIHDLSGSGTLNGYDIILDGVDVTRFARALSEDARVGDSMMGLWKGASKGGQSAFDTLDGGFVINQGVVQINKMNLDGAASLIETKGNINLPNWTLATKHNITVKGSDITPSDVPPFEVSFSGSLDNPAQTFGQGLLDDYLKRKIQRKFNKLLSDKLGVSSSDNTEKEQQQNATPKPSAEDDMEKAIKGILGGLLR